MSERGTFTSSVLGFMVYDDGDRLPLGPPDRASFDEQAFELRWPDRVVHHAGKAVAIAMVTARGGVSVVPIKPVAVQRGCIFAGSMVISMPEYLIGEADHD